MLIRRKISVSLQGRCSIPYNSQHFPEESAGAGKLLLRDQPPWPWLGASMENILTFIARGCFASSEGRGDQKGNKSTKIKNKEFLKV